MCPRRLTRESSNPTLRTRLTVLAIAASALLPASSLVSAPAAHAQSGGLISQVKPKWQEFCQRAYLKIHKLEELHALKDKVRQTTERNPQFLDDLEMLRENKFANQTLGAVNTKFVPEFDTRFYFTTSAKPRPNGSIPMVDPESDALFIYLHGSGTEKASGLTFAQKMNAMQRLNMSVIAFDLPFHADGTRNLAMANTREFQDYLRRLILSVKRPGQPVYLLGHSFGPEPSLEFIARTGGHVVHGVGAISPAGWDKVTTRWQSEKTDRMFESLGDVVNNDAGGIWADAVARDNIWNKVNHPLRVDPTLTDRAPKIEVVSGEWEEYIPGPLDEKGMPAHTPREYDVEKFFRRAFRGADVNVRIEPGVGHYIFMHNDADGQDVVLRTAVKLNGYDLAKDGAMLRERAAARSRAQTSVEILAGRYAREPFLRGWMDRLTAEQNPGENGQALIARLLKVDDKKAASNLARDYQKVQAQRLEAMNGNIRATEAWAPEFFAANRAEIEKLGTRSYDPSKLYELYSQFLEKADPALRASRAVASDAVYVLPKREAPAGFRPELANPQAPRGKKQKKGKGQAQPVTEAQE